MFLGSLFFFSLSQACERAVKPSRYFSEFSIAKAIEQLGPDGYIFAMVLHGFNYDTLAKKYNRTEAEIEAIALNGIDIMMRYKREGL